MYDGLEADNRLSEFHLDPNLRKHHRYLTDHSQTSQTHIDKFQQLKVGFKLLGFQDSEVDIVYRILAAILHLGDIEFGEVASEDNTDNKSRVIDAAPLHRGTFTTNLFLSFFFVSLALLFCFFTFPLATKFLALSEKMIFTNSVNTFQFHSCSVWRKMIFWKH